MKTKMILACAGMAACAAQAQVDRPALQSAESAGVIFPDTVQPILGITMDRRLVLGEERQYTRGDGNAAARGGLTVTRLYNAAGLGMDTDGDGTDDVICGDLCGGLSFPGSRWFFGPTFATQAVADDFEYDVNLAAGADAFSGFTSLVNWLSCGGAGDTGTEPAILIFTMYDSVDLTADLDGVNDGFDTDGDGVNDSPYDVTDTDGDGLIDQFTGGVVVTFANIDTDGDTSNGGEILDADTDGYYVLFAEELTDTDGDGVVGDPGAVDFGGFPVGDRDGDGNPDGTFELFVAGSEGPDTDGDGDGDSGDIFNQYFAPTSLVAQVMIWGPPSSDNSSPLCAEGDGVNEVTSNLGWAQGLNPCPAGSTNEGAGFSDGALDGGVVNNIWDISIDATDFAGVVACPDPVGYAVSISGEGTGDGGNDGPCADTNQNGVVDPGDFNAWILQFNTQGPFCDQNGDGLCNPGDFNAWILNFNSGAPCP
ncbi:MAG: hypothetical protein AAGJ54_07975 [Planctomycetota bacterium]